MKHEKHTLEEFISQGDHTVLEPFAAIVQKLHETEEKLANSRSAQQANLDESTEDNEDVSMEDEDSTAVVGNDGVDDQTILHDGAPPAVQTRGPAFGDSDMIDSFGDEGLTLADDEAAFDTGAGAPSEGLPGDFNGMTSMAAEGDAEASDAAEGAGSQEDVDMEES
ncbi:hypothetical protein K461DRAFT_282707 [Myriangium duriaei CBS 260.36]|uniref:Uncharacterized protein n=1 Tax=Myriangium duriaei CBS 260.36 TaxID=1168546 RepID=A0A9P4MFU1_9PEZI|nr:hypothetical protein K461DRAFT_282707 [Myriangium duriaei CBS 260.36]